MPEAKSTDGTNASVDMSIVIPFYNDEALISPLAERLKEVFGTEGEYEFILVDDGSGDKTFEKLSALHGEDGRFQVIGLNRNFGQRRAVTEGMKAARGRVIATMDPDLQNDPADILKLEKLLVKDNELANGCREKRHESIPGRRLPSYITNKILSLVSGVKIKDFGSPMAVFRVELVRKTMELSPNGLFSKTLASMVTGKVVEIPIAHRPRSAGSSSYNFQRLLKVFHFLVFTALELRLLMMGLSPLAIKRGLIAAFILNVLFIIASLKANSLLSILFPAALSMTLLILMAFALSLKKNKRLKEEAHKTLQNRIP